MYTRALPLPRKSFFLFGPRGTWVRPWQPRRKVREASHPKFHFFDPGVVRALTGRLRDPLDPGVTFDVTGQAG